MNGDPSFRTCTLRGIEKMILFNRNPRESRDDSIKGVRAFDHLTS